MTCEQISNLFDTYYNNINNGLAPGITEEEKQDFLNRAQDDIIRHKFSKLNKTLEGYDESEERKVDFSTITKVITYEGFYDEKGELKEDYKGMFDYHKNTISVISYSEQFKPLYIINEYVEVERKYEENTFILSVLPINYKEYSRLISRPYKRPLKGQCWKLNADKNKSDLIVGSMDKILKYSARYIEAPNRIDLKEQKMTNLPESLHEEIVLRAVELAKATYLGDLSTQINLGTVSQTNIGR